VRDLIVHCQSCSNSNIVTSSYLTKRARLAGKVLNDLKPARVLAGWVKNKRKENKEKEPKKAPTRNSEQVLIKDTVPPVASAQIINELLEAPSLTKTLLH